MLQAFVSMLIGLVVMMVMVVCFLTATLVLLTVMSWIVNGASRVFATGSRNRPLG